MTRTITPYEQNGVCGVVEGQPQAVDQFLGNAGSVQRGRSRRSAIDDPLVANQANVVKVTTYEPVQEPLGMPTMNFADDLTIGAVEDQPDDYAPAKAPPAPANQPVQKKKKALYIAGAHPTDNGPLGLPDMQWDEPAETAEGERATTNTAPQPGPQQNKRQAKTGGGPLGLPSMDW